MLILLAVGLFTGGNSDSGGPRANLCSFRCVRRRGKRYRMHELSVALDIIEVAEAKAREKHSPGIQTIKVRLGEFTTIAREALEFAFEVARRGTLAAEARLEIEMVAMATRCVSCGPVEEAVRGLCLLCPQCGLPLEVVAGKELQIEYLELQ